MARTSSPYLVPQDGVAKLGLWQLHREGAWAPAPTEFDGWDSGTDISLHREVDVKLSALRQEARLPDDVSIKVVTSWESSTTGMTGRAGESTVSTSGSFLHQVLLPGGRVGGVVTMRTTVILGDVSAATPGVAHLAGSVFLEDKFKLALEGTMGMFPVAVVDFAHTPYDPDASWHLTTSPDLEAPFMGRFQLEINARDTELVKAIGADKPSDRQLALVDDLRHQVAMLMLEFAQLSDQEGYLTGNEWSPDTVGDALSRVLAGSGEGQPTQPVTVIDVADRLAQREGATRRNGQGRGFR